MSIPKLTRRFAIAILSLALSQFAMMAQQTSSAVPALISTAPSIVGRIGPYGGIKSVQDARQMTLDGFNLVIPSRFSQELRTELRGDGALYIDLTLWSLINERCKKEYESRSARHLPRVCTISVSDEEDIVTAARKHIGEVAKDPGLAGFWILDDYPGSDISRILKRFHQIVSEAGAASGRHLPTVCGLQGELDARDSTNQPIKPHHQYVDRAITNVSPDACDYVSPYPYGYSLNSDPALVDWSLHDVIPYTIQLLRAKGFNTSGLLIPLLHAFGNNPPPGSYRNVTPRPQDILAQAKAWTDAGAVALMFFTWQSADADVSYANSPSIRDGVQQAAAYFRAHHH
jgi:hypothetical protein